MCARTEVYLLTRIRAESLNAKVPNVPHIGNSRDRRERRGSLTARKATPFAGRHGCMPEGCGPGSKPRAILQG